MPPCKHTTQYRYVKQATRRCEFSIRITQSGQCSIFDEYSIELWCIQGKDPSLCTDTTTKKNHAVPSNEYISRNLTRDAKFGQVDDTMSLIEAHNQYWSEMTGVYDSIARVQIYHFSSQYLWRLAFTFDIYTDTISLLDELHTSAKKMQSMSNLLIYFCLEQSTQFKVVQNNFRQQIKQIFHRLQEFWP